MDKNKFSIKKALSFSWEKAQEHVKFFLVMFLFNVAIVVPIYILDAFLSKQELILAATVNLLVSLAYNLFYFVFSIALIKVFLEISRGTRPSFNSFLATLKPLFTDWKLLLNYILTSCLYGLIVFGGFLLFIVPGVIWGIKYSQWSYLVIDKGLKPVEAMKESGRITQGSKAKMFLLDMSYVGVVIIGFLPSIFTLGFGFYLIGSMMMMSNIYVYLKLVEPWPVLSEPLNSAVQS
ncbi:hypothetical protein KKH63_00475 [Patescibacteria group bacterium]|nr:hypothetical protein [Patescibacteria group bacterium]